MSATASAKLLDPLLQVARHLQQDPGDLLSFQGIDPARVEQPGARIPARLFNALLEDFARRTGNPRIALRVGEATLPRMLGSVGFVISTAPTLGEAYRLLGHYMPLLVEGVSLSLTGEEKLASLDVVLEDDRQHALAEWLLACLHNWPRWLCGRQLPLTRVELAAPPPPDLRGHEQFFATEVHFSAGHNRLSFDAALLDLPCLEASEELLRHHQSFADQLLSRSGRDGALVARLKSLIRASLEQGQPIDRKRAAEQLAMSLRTMQRKLDQQQTSYQQIYDAMRQEMALQLIQRGDKTLGEISYQLGFSSLSAFQKAFRRWTGMPPGQWRSRHQPEPQIMLGGEPQTLVELAGSGLGEEEFLTIATELVNQLIRRWQRGEPSDLHPARIGVHLDAGGQPHLALQRPSPLPPTLRLPFEPPECNGLLPYEPDRRSDHYRLGALFCYLLQAAPPHQGRELPVLLINQLQQPPELPDPISTELRLVLARLLARLPEDRYQQTGALLADLQQIRIARSQGQHLDQFRAGSLDHPPFDSPQMLFGRDDLLAGLEQAILALARGERARRVILGAPGSGRHALFNPLRAMALRSQTPVLAIDGRRHPPDQCALALARQLVLQKLVLPAPQRNIAAQRLRRQAGRRLGEMCQWLPELAALTESATEADGATVPTGEESFTLLATLVAAHAGPLLSVVLLPEQPDDHWRTLLELLDDKDKGGRLTLAMASEDPELPGWPVHRLAALSREDLRRWIGQLFGRLDAERQALADWLHSTSEGHPASVVTTLERMRQRGWLQYRNGHWQWRATEVAGSQDPQLTQLLDRTFASLPAPTRQMMQWAAVAGDPFTAAQLAEARRDPVQRIEIHLWPAAQAGLLRSSQGVKSALRFSHPDLRARILATLSQAQQQQLRWRIGRTLMRQWRRTRSPSSLHRAAELLTQALPGLPHQRLLRQPLSQLCRQAAADARSRGNLHLALLRIRDAVTLAQDSAAPDLLLEAAEMALSNGALEQAEAWLEQASSACPQALEPRLWILRADLADRRGEREQAVAMLRAGLERQRCPLPLAAETMLEALAGPAPETGNARPLLDAIARQAEERVDSRLAAAVLAGASGSDPEARAASRWMLLGQPPERPAALPTSVSDGLALSLALRWQLWQQPVAEQIPWLERQTAARRLSVAPLLAAHRLWLGLLAGEPIDALERRLPQDDHPALAPLRRLLKALQGEGSMDQGEETSAWETLARFLDTALGGRPLSSAPLLKLCNTVEAAFSGLPELPELLLLAASLIHDRRALAAQAERPMLQRHLERIAEQLRHWQVLCPSRFAPMADIAQALTGAEEASGNACDGLLARTDAPLHRLVLLRALAGACRGRGESYLASLIEADIRRLLSGLGIVRAGAAPQPVQV